MEYNFYLKVMVLVDFSDEEFKIIFDNAAKHYDHTVRMSTEPGEYGFLYGTKGHLEWCKNPACSEPYRLREYTFRQLDLMCKALEMDRTEEAWIVGNKIRKILNFINSKGTEVNEPIKDNLTTL